MVNLKLNLKFEHQAVGKTERVNSKSRNFDVATKDDKTIQSLSTDDLIRVIYLITASSTSIYSICSFRNRSQRANYRERHLSPTSGRVNNLVRQLVIGSYLIIGIPPIKKPPGIDNFGCFFS